MTDNRILLALVGEMGSGKTTIANYLINNYHFKLVRISGKIKEIISSVDLQLGRDIQQELGELFRKYDDDVWVRQAVKEINRTTDSIIIDDIRRLNEYNYLRPLGFKFIKVIVPENIRRKRIEIRDKITITDEQWDKWKHHMTEIQIPIIPYDFILYNSKSEEELFQEIDRLIKNLFNHQSSSGGQ